MRIIVSLTAPDCGPPASRRVLPGALPMRVARERPVSLAMQFLEPAATTTEQIEFLMKLHFSINALALLLEHDRGTLTRALRDFAPDRIERGRPLWKVSTAVDALERRGTRSLRRHRQHPTGKYRDQYDFHRTTALDPMRLEFEKQVALIGAAKSFDKRRDMALKLAPLLHQYQTTYLEIGRSLHTVEDDVLSARAELIWHEMMDEVSAAAEWPRDAGDFWVRMCEPIPCDIDADEVI
ncbi:hypothetical protein EI171_35680 [Bradyrhizobium sp. LCT2]|uniref:hypothetical protein n=1 Tax=Bradyrhizobium sp. LCT2 TaxID=2493093 RepID=UPI001373B3D0|nr:hypothetical protein [Bradyrhizobium sp. LCT2]QHP72178.1 hypothetical protein EI171_35680 [Bradyrhizobium sp. LCT2]